MSIFVDALTKTFDGHPAVDAVSFSVHDNAFFCVVGASGCGKSTLLRLIAGLEEPDHGRIELNNTPVVAPGLFVPPEERNVGVVFQSYALWPHMTVSRNVAFPYEARGLSASDALARAGEHLNTVPLETFADRRPEALSGGQRQRVALARCLAGDARTILMDEPLANLDPHLRGEMESELRAFHNRSGATTLYITHDQREAMALADIMAVMDGGKFLQIGCPEDIYERPATETVARFIGRGALLKADIRNGSALIAGQTTPVASKAEGLKTVFIRPKNIAVGETGWRAEIRSVHYRGGFWEAVACGDGLETPIMLDLPKAVKIGEQVHLTFTGGWVIPN
ncbi:MAG: ABC transporter ATP-binding protein [Hyphomicrobiales bacterium]|nr:ABC transporter ATP-binding protein [Hyphomicrobiales bacterium]